MKLNGNKPVVSLSVIGLLILFLTSCASSRFGSVASEETKVKYHAIEIEEYLEALTDESSPGFSYLISKDGIIVAVYRGALSETVVQHTFLPAIEAMRAP